MYESWHRASFHHKKQKPKYKIDILLLKSTIFQGLKKNTFFEVVNCPFKNLKTSFVFLRLFFLVKRSSMPVFIKNINTLTSWKVLKTMIYLRQRAQCVPANFFGIWSSKIIPDHWLIALFWPSIKSFHSPPLLWYLPYLIGNRILSALAVWSQSFINKWSEFNRPVALQSFV